MQTNNNNLQAAPGKKIISIKVRGSYPSYIYIHTLSISIEHVPHTQYPIRETLHPSPSPTSLTVPPSPPPPPLPLSNINT